MHQAGFVPGETGKSLCMGENTQNSRPSDATLEEERREAKAEHAPDRPPSGEEENAAPERDDLKEGVAEHFEEMAERGADVKGEGEVP